MRTTVKDILEKKKRKERITVITAYDYSTAKICDSSGIDIILVGDSAGMVMLGLDSTIPVTVDEMLVFCKGVINGAKSAMVVADMPFGSYQIDNTLALSNAIKFIKLGCHAVKMEGGDEIIPIVKRLTEMGIPVMGHIGLKPQTTVLQEGYRVQGKTCDSAIQLLNDAKNLEKSGVFCIVLELVTKEVSTLISQNVQIPVIGIGSGYGCDGQVLVFHDLVYLYDNIKPKFVKQYANALPLFSSAIKNYTEETRLGIFPSDEHSFSMDQFELDKFKKYLKKHFKDYDDNPDEINDNAFRD